MVIDFKKFGVYNDIAKKELKHVDVQSQIANLLYTMMAGIEAHALAFKIYNAKDAEDYNEQEIAILKTVFESYCKVNFLDAFETIINNTKN